jgi:hypothetical protein
MQTSGRELLTMIHGMLFGGLFLMACFGVLVLLHRSLAAQGAVELTEAGRRRESAYLILMAALGWAAVLSGAYLIYPWYRAALPPGVTDLSGYPQRLLLSNQSTAGWHTLGMEWKEHVAWFAPMLMTAAAFILLRYQSAADEHRGVRRAVVWFAGIALVAACVAGAFGALINKHAPVIGGTTIRLTRGAP